MADRIEITTENHIAVMTIRRPEKLNAFDIELLQELSAACDRVEADGSVQTSGGCGSGGCAPSCAAPGAGGSASRLEETAQGWILNVLDGELHHPVALTTQLSLALSEIFLAETASASAPVEEPRAVSRDLAAVALGLGLIVLEGSFIYSKSCGGPSLPRSAIRS